MERGPARKNSRSRIWAELKSTTRSRREWSILVNFADSFGTIVYKRPSFAYVRFAMENSNRKPLPDTRVIDLKPFSKLWKIFGGFSFLVY
jgi:cbb3-type cytochrome oxidase subunit 3